MNQPTSQADYLKLWQDRLRAMAENAADLSHLDSRRDKLQNVVNLTLTGSQEQSAATATKQDATRRLEDLLSEGRAVFTFLSAGIREYYGKDSEKLSEFGMKPFRGRRSRKTVPTPPAPEAAR